MTGKTKWKYKEVCSFLKSNGFTLIRVVGSHEQWKKTEEKDILVTVYRMSGSDHYPPNTFSSIVRQSGIEDKKWRDWKFR